MGTRNLICAVVDGDFKIAQYTQWDGYPVGQGKKICAFFGDPDLDLNRMKANLRACSWLTDEEHEAIMKPYAQDGWMTIEKADEFRASEWGYLSRDTGALILSKVYEKPRKLADSLEFCESGSCEWAYIVNFDREVLEVYSRYHKGIEAASGFGHRDAPNLVEIIPFINLKHYNMETLEDRLQEQDEAEEEEA